MPLSPEQQAEIDAQRRQKQQTLRAVAPGMEAHLYTARPVLDHGFVRVIDYMGDDAAICQAARVSYGKGTKSVQNDEGLIRYLMRHWHSTPFEMCEVKLHVKLPVFVARQWIRHRTANVNEYSARYSILDREFYMPAPEHINAQSVVNNQGRGEVLSPEDTARVLEMLKADSARCYENYQAMIDEDGIGLAAGPAHQGEGGAHGHCSRPEDHRVGPTPLGALGDAEGEAAQPPGGAVGDAFVVLEAQQQRHAGEAAADRGGRDGAQEDPEDRQREQPQQQPGRGKADPGEHGHRVPPSSAP